jgi:hypothetical protein
MESKKSLNNYDFFLDEISLIIKPEVQPIITELRGTRPWDLVNIASEFKYSGGKRGLIWSIFISKALNNFDFINL